MTNSAHSFHRFHLVYVCFLMPLFVAIGQDGNDYKEKIAQGTALNDASKYEDALLVFNALAAEKDAMGPKDVMEMNYEIATTHYYLGAYSLSIQHILEMIALAEQVDSARFILQGKQFAGEIYRASDNPALSKKYLSEALVLAQNQNKLRSIAYCLNRLGVVAYISSELDRADSLFQASLAIAEANEFISVVSMNLNDMGEFYFSQGKPERSLEIYRNALKLSLDLDIEINLMNNMANAYWKMEQYDLAILNAEKAWKMADKANILTLAERAVRIIADCHMSQGNFEQGIIYYRKYMNYHGRLFDAQKDAQILELETKYETERKQYEIEEQKSQLALLAAKNDSQKIIAVGISISLVLGFGFIYANRSKRFALKSKELQEAFSQQLLAYQESERQRISRDLHDSIGQSLILIKNKVQLDNDTSTSDMVAKTLEEVRSISKQLHPVLLEKLGLTASIEKLVADIDGSTSIFVECELDMIDGIFTKEMELHIYRIIQESMNNLIKHSDTPSALVKIENRSDHIKCSIIDHGKGFDLTENPKQFKSLGMLTLKERTKILKGNLIIDSSKGKGTAIILTIEKPKA